jgi:hypothetical protein
MEKEKGNEYEHCSVQRWTFAQSRTSGSELSLRVKDLCFKN